MKEVDNKLELALREFDHYSNHRSYLISEKHNVEQKFMTHLTYLSVGVFTFSISIEPFIDSNECKLLLVISWVFALISLISILFSFDFSKKSYDLEIKNWDKTKGKDKGLGEKNPHTNMMKISISISRTCLLFSLFILGIFYSINFLNMSDSQKSENNSVSVPIQKNSEPTSAGISPTQFIQGEAEDSSTSE